jgi:hypothetical protein
MTSGTTTTASPGAQVQDAAAYCLELAVTWLRWDGRPLTSEDGDRIYTPHKVIRRIADHLIDHVAEVEALLAGVDTQPDAWRASEITLESDWASFTEADLGEARERITRLARTFALRLAALEPAEWDAPRTPNWTVREIADHLTGITWYANQLGRL